MPRLFSGLEVPAAIGERLAMLRGGLEGARWIEPENYHLTLRFFGDVDQTIARDVADALAGVRATAFEIRLDGLGSFGGRKPRAIWAGLAPCPPLADLRRSHERAARVGGLAPESRNFTPHVTLARLRGVKPTAVAQFLEQFGAFASLPFEVTRFVLFSSRNSRGGGPYVIEETYPLDSN